MRLKIEKSRILLSRIAAAAVLFFLCSTESYWETENEMISFLLFFLGMLLVTVASLGRMWCSVYIAGFKDQKLITKGPYSLCRNPLYLFSSVGIVGIGLCTETFTYPFIFLILFSIYYPFVIKSEQKRLASYFGAEFEEYKGRVPAFFPRFSSLDEPLEYTVNPMVYRRHISSAVWFVWIVGIIELMEGLRAIEILPHLWTLY